MADDKATKFSSGFCRRLLTLVNKEFGNTLTSLLSMAGADYAGELNGKYQGKDLDFKLNKFVEVMKSYDVNVKVSRYDKNGSEVVELVCENCVFDSLGLEDVNFCSYSESFLRKYAEAKRIERIKREGGNSGCT